MLTKKLLAAVGIAGALLAAASTEASADPWRPVVVAPAYGPAYNYNRVVVAPAYQPVYRPVVVAPPVYVPAPRVVVAPAYPVYRPYYFRHPHWHRRYW